MTTRQQDSEDEQIRLLTVSDQLKWEAKWERVLYLARQERNRKLDDNESERFARATDAIITELRQLQKLGYSRDEAGHKLVFAPGANILGSRSWTAEDLREILQALAIDWRVAPRSADMFGVLRHG